MNASNNDYWVGDPEVDSRPTFLELFSAFPRRGARGTKRNCTNKQKSQKQSRPRFPTLAPKFITQLPRFSGPSRGSRRTSLAERHPQGGSPRVREDPLGTPPLSAKKVSENLEKVPRIWEVEGPGGPK